MERSKGSNSWSVDIVVLREMASFAEVGRYNRNTPGVDLTKGGIYAIQPHVIAAPAPIKVGYSGNLMSRMAQYHAMYPYGFDILALGRTNTRNMAYSRNRDDAILAESHMLRSLHDYKAYGKEWMDGSRLTEVLAALKEAHAKYTGQGVLGSKLYTGTTLRYLVNRPSERRMSVKQPPPPLPKPVKRLPKKQPISKPSEAEIIPPPIAEPAPVVKRVRNELSQKELERGVKQTTGVMTLQKRTRRGGMY